MLILSNDTQQREQHAVAADLEREGGGAAGGREGGSSGSERVCVWRERGSEGARERGGERASEGASERESERERAREGGKRAPPSPPSRVCVEGGTKEGSEGGGGGPRLPLSPALFSLSHIPCSRRACRRSGPDTLYHFTIILL